MIIGMGLFGQMARSATMTQPDNDGKYAIKKMFLNDVTDSEGDTRSVPAEAVVKESFLKPKPVIFASQPNLQRRVIEVACGMNHMLVVARNPQSVSGRGNLYSAGLNQYGQLGMGDTDERHALTLVRV
jgi:alpha-tubulin suppressor-like RCC1 family protein